MKLANEWFLCQSLEIIKDFLRTPNEQDYKNSLPVKKIIKRDLLEFNVKVKECFVNFC